MVKGHCTHSWLAGFAARLMQLRPQIGVGRAVAYAVASIHNAADVDPRRAAEEMFAKMDPTTEPGSRRRVQQGVDSAVPGYARLLGRLLHPTTHRAHG